MIYLHRDVRLPDGTHDLQRTTEPDRKQILASAKQLDDNRHPAVIIGQSEDPWSDQTALFIVGEYGAWTAFAGDGSWLLKTDSPNDDEVRFWSRCEIICEKQNITMHFENIVRVVDCYLSELHTSALGSVVLRPERAEPYAECEGQLHLFNGT